MHFFWFCFNEHKHTLSFISTCNTNQEPQTLLMNKLHTLNNTILKSESWFESLEIKNETVFHN